MFVIKQHTSIKLCYILIDILFFSISIFLAAWIRHSTLPFPVTISHLFFNPANPFREIIFFWMMATIFINNGYGLYQTKREVYETVEIWQVIRSVVLSTLLTIVIIFLENLEDFPRSLLIYASIFIVVSFSFWRICKRCFVEYLVLKGYNNFNALIIGSGKVGVALAQEIHKRPGLGIRLIGFLDDVRVNKEDHPEMSIVGKVADFEQIARREFIHEIFITMHHDHRVFSDLLEQAKTLGIAVRVVPQGFDLISSDFCRYNIGFIPILEYCNEEVFRKHFGKRIFDFFASVTLMIFLFPVFFVLSILIKMDSPGPIFYFSQRYGRKGRIFNMYKFRSMVKDADQILSQIQHQNEMDGPIFKIKEDPRVTRIGRFLRRYSLDELPQLFNVFKGDMSLVGPRPFPIQQIEKEDYRQIRRLEFKPGITGLWQIRGRSDTSFARLVRWDMWYINNWSFWLDLHIMLQTIPVVLRGKGAY